MIDSKIEWTDHTLNLWWGCSKVHAGCKNCYAATLSNRFNKEEPLWGENVPRQAKVSAFKSLAAMQRGAKKNNRIESVFVGSMMDIFEDSKPLQQAFAHEDMAYATHTGGMRQLLFNNISNGDYPNLRFLFLTKRPQNIAKMIPFKFYDMPNLYFGTSVSDRNTIEYADILRESAKGLKKFLSIEPQLEEIRSTDINLKEIDWVIQGGESGSKKRPFDIDWAYTMRDTCKAQNIPYFFKQIDGKKEVPQDLMIREFPKD